jgi:hypothetical protein
MVPIAAARGRCTGDRGAKEALPFRIVADFGGTKAGLRGWGPGRGGFLVGRYREVFMSVVEVLLINHLRGGRDTRSPVAQVETFDTPNGGGFEVIDGTCKGYREPMAKDKFILWVNPHGEKLR